MPKRKALCCSEPEQWPLHVWIIGHSMSETRWINRSWVSKHILIIIQAHGCPAIYFQGRKPRLHCRKYLCSFECIRKRVKCAYGCIPNQKAFLPRNRHHIPFTNTLQIHPDVTVIPIDAVAGHPCERHNVIVIISLSNITNPGFPSCLYAFKHVCIPYPKH